MHEYAKNLSLLFITDEAIEVREYNNFFHFLFKELYFNVDYEDAFNVYEHNQNTIDLVIIHVSGNIDKVRTLTQAIRKLSDDTYIFAYTTSKETRENFVTSSCFCADGFVPTPFDKDNIYKYFYRFLKRIIEMQELNEYVNGLEIAYNALLTVENRFNNYLKKLDNVEHIDKEKLIAELSSIKNKVHDNLELEDNYIKETQTHTIAQEKLNDIRFTQNNKMSASEFIATLDDTIIDKVEDFLGMLDEYAFTLDDFSHANAVQSLSDIASVTTILREFYYTVDTLACFPVITRTFDGIINFLNSLSAAQLEEKEKKSTLVLILEGLGNDLEDWITHLFIDRTVDNIHYFDASFANNTLEMEAIFAENELESGVQIHNLDKSPLQLKLVG